MIRSVPKFCALTHSVVTSELESSSMSSVSKRVGFPNKTISEDNFCESIFPLAIFVFVTALS